MNVFDIIGPVMIGPSSSHTAGAVRLGRVVNKLVDDRILKKVKIVLSGSFAETYKGHGTDRALLAGIMLDTKDYTLRVGVRTFDAASYLRGCKADTVAVRELFAGTAEGVDLARVREHRLLRKALASLD